MHRPETRSASYSSAACSMFRPACRSRVSSESRNITYRPRACSMPVLRGFEQPPLFSSRRTKRTRGSSAASLAATCGVSSEE